MRGIICKDIYTTHSVAYYGALGDGITDDTDALKLALETTNGVLNFEDKTYIVSDVLFVNKQNMKIHGNGAILKRINNVHIFEFPHDATNVEVTRLCFDGNKESVANKMSSVFVKGDHITFDNCIFENSSDHGIGFDGQGLDTCKFNTIKNCTIKHNNGIGISNNMSSENKILDNTICYNGLEGITLDNFANFSIVKGNRLHNNCTIGGVGVIGIDATKYCVVSDNIISEIHNQKPGITTQNNISKCEHNIISNNIIVDVEKTSENNNYGIELHSFNNAQNNTNSKSNLVTCNIVENGISNLDNNTVTNNLETQMKVLIEKSILEFNNIIDLDTLDFPSLNSNYVTQTLSTESLNCEFGVPHGYVHICLVTKYNNTSPNLKLQVISLLGSRIKYTIDDVKYDNNDLVSDVHIGVIDIKIELVYNNSRSRAFSTSEKLEVLVNDNPINMNNFIKYDTSKTENFKKVTQWYSKRNDGNLFVPFNSKTSWKPIHDYYPRPYMKRDLWTNLNGKWSLSLDNLSETIPGDDLFANDIIVPFPIEALNSQICKESTHFWYKKPFRLGKQYINKKVILHFGAVDYKCWIYIDGNYLGYYNEKNIHDTNTNVSHVGGFDNFSFDITSYVNIDQDHALYVKVVDESASSQIKGKQVTSPSNIWYTTCSGIWQSVWVEGVSLQNSIHDIFVKPTLSGVSVEITPAINNANCTYTIEIFDKSKKTVYKGNYTNGSFMTIENPQLWSPKNPYLYTYTLTMYDQGSNVDNINGYFALRSIHVEDRKVYLNNQNVYMFGSLDQGYWPDGIYTAPSIEGMKYDIEFAKSIGQNVLRKHVKVEPQIWYYLCDQIGMLVMQDIPSSRTSSAGPHIHEVVNIVKNLRNYPSIVMWVLYNEGWGYSDDNANQRCDVLVNYDTIDTNVTSDMVQSSYVGRLLNVESGSWNNRYIDSEVLRRGHIFSRHHYTGYNKHSSNVESEVDFFISNDYHPNLAFMLDEYGGYRFDSPDFYVYGSWGYQTLDKTEFTQKYNEDANMLYSKYKHETVPLQGVIYTQLTDVENETNGLMTYKRTPKLNKSNIKFTMNI